MTAMLTPFITTRNTLFLIIEPNPWKNYCSITVTPQHSPQHTANVKFIYLSTQLEVRWSEVIWLSYLNMARQLSLLIWFMLVWLHIHSCYVPRIPLALPLQHYQAEVWSFSWSSSIYLSLISCLITSLQTRAHLQSL